jgi:CBS domain-containing protein
VLTTTRVADAARFMAELGIGDVIVTDPETGAVVGMLTDRDIAVRLVGRNLSAAATPVGDVCTTSPMTIEADEDLDRALELMVLGSVRRLPVVDQDGKPVGIVAIEDLAASSYVSDAALRDLMRSFASTYHRRRVMPAGR